MQIKCFIEWAVLEWSCIEWKEFDHRLRCIDSDQCNEMHKTIVIENDALK